jgi:hypothetical protein
MRSALLTLAFGLTLTLALPAAAQDEPEFTQDFDVDDCRFSNVGRNAYFSLNPGDRLILEGDDDGEALRLQITVLHRTQFISFRTDEGDWVWVSARVVEEREWLDGELVEVSRNFYARCLATNDIFYFGEDVDIYEDGEIVSHDGEWRAGRAGALPGIIMPGRFLLGARYYQENAAPVALDRAEHTRQGFDVLVPAGHLEDCVEVVETSPLEPGHESVKVYCEEVGLVSDGPANLTRYRVRRWE